MSICYKIKEAFKLLKKGQLFKFITTRSKIKRLLNKSKNGKISDEEYLVAVGKIYLGYTMDLKNPKTFNEKINWYKLHYYNPLMVKCVDKIEVGNYVESKGLKDILVPKLKVWDSVDDINIDELPEKFVIKTNADSGGVIIVTDKSKFDYKQLDKIKYYLSKDFSNGGKEWPYGEVKKQIFAEAYLDDNEHKVPYDYKFFCFNGRVEYLMVCSERDIALKQDLFDREFNWLNILCKSYPNNVAHRPTKPLLFDKMIEYAEILSKDFPQVRVDFYQINGKIYFGELTFYTDAGFGKFGSYNEDLQLGTPFNINSIKKSEFYKE